MKVSSRRRLYQSEVRVQAAHNTRRRILKAAAILFARKGIDAVTIEQIATRAKVAGSTVYATFKSKDGILRGLMEQSLFGAEFQEAQRLLDGVTDPVTLIRLTSRVSRAIYESESSDLGLLRRASGFSPALRKMEEEFERLRYQKQEARLQLLFASGQARAGLSLDDARRILWMYTSRDVYRMLVSEGGWTADRYQEWLARTLVEALVGLQ